MTRASTDLRACCAARAPYDDAVYVKPERRAYSAFLIDYLPACFAGLWFSHVPIERRHSFLQSLHARLEPGARVVLLDNSMAQRRELPITEHDAQGNTDQERVLRDGTTYRVLKNFPTEDELMRSVLSGAHRATHRELENFWRLQYELARAA